MILNVLSDTARGQCILNEIQKLTASDGAPGDEFGGFRIAICGDTAVIGAYYSDDNGVDSGAAYVFRFDGLSWHEEAKLLPSDGAAGDAFGSCVGCSGDTAIVGAFGDDDACPEDPLFCNSGAAYVFGRDDNETPSDPTDDFWVEKARLLASDAAADSYLGRECPILADTVVVGAHHANADDSGAAYVFQEPSAGWVDMTETQKLMVSDGAPQDEFGVSVAISGETLVIGALYDDDACPEDPLCDSGSAYVFERDDNETPSDPTDDFWVEKAKLLASDAASGDQFGLGVGIDAQTALIGAHLDDNENGTNAGSAYVFQRPETGWAGTMFETQKLLPNDLVPGATFGSSVAIFGDAVLIGANYDDAHGGNSGSAYLFQRDTNNTPSDRTDDFWVEKAKLLASDGAAGDNFGWPVAISDDTALIGAFLSDNENGVDAGSAYVFDLGQECPAIPAVSVWGLIATTLLLFTAGTLLYRGRDDASPIHPRHTPLLRA